MPLFFMDNVTVTLFQATWLVSEEDDSNCLIFVQTSGRIAGMEGPSWAPQFNYRW